MRAAASSAGQAQQQFATAYRDSVQHVELDDAFSRLRSAVESHAGLLQKQVAVRVRNWLKKLDEEVRPPALPRRATAIAAGLDRCRRHCWPPHFAPSQLACLPNRRPM